MELQGIGRLFHLALQHWEAGNHAEAEKLLDEALALAQLRLPNGHSEIAAVRLELAAVHAHFRRFHEARNLLRQIVSEHHGRMPDSVRFAIALLDYAELS